MSDDDIMNMMKTSNRDSSWEDLCRFGHGNLLSNEFFPKPAVKAAKSTDKADSSVQVRYHVLPHQTEEDMNQAEVSSHDLVRASAESVHQSVLWDDSVSELERAKWLQGLHTELDTMSEKGMLKAVTREEARETWSMSSLSELPTPVPSKLVLARKPVLSHSVSER